MEEKGRERVRRRGGRIRRRERRRMKCKWKRG
jgi:hypothetical protein